MRKMGFMWRCALLFLLSAFMLLSVFACSYETANRAEADEDEGTISTADADNDGAAEAIVSAEERFVVYVKLAQDGDCLEQYVADLNTGETMLVAEMTSTFGASYFTINNTTNEIYYLDNVTSTSTNICRRKLFSDDNPEILVEVGSAVGAFQFSNTGDRILYTCTDGLHMIDEDGDKNITNGYDKYLGDTFWRLSSNGEHAVYVAEDGIWRLWSEEGGTEDIPFDGRIVSISDDGDLFYTSGKSLYKRGPNGETVKISESIFNRVLYPLNPNNYGHYGHFLPDGTGYYAVKEVGIYYYDGINSTLVKENSGSYFVIPMSQTADSIFCGELIYKDNIIHIEGYDGLRYAQTNGEYLYFTSVDVLYSARLQNGTEVGEIQEVATGVNCYYGIHMTPSGGLCYIVEGDNGYNGYLYYCSVDGEPIKIDENVSYIIPYGGIGLR